MNKESDDLMMVDDLFFSAILFTVGGYATHINWVESDFLGLFGTLALTVFAAAWFSLRVYHLTHPATDGENNE